MKNTLLLIFTTCIIILLYISYSFRKDNKGLNSKLTTAINNIKAYKSTNDSLRDKCIYFKYTVEELETYNDSILDKLIKVQHELGIKDKNLKQLQYIESKAERRDTIIFRDTIFKSPTLKVDTLIGNEWYYAKLKLEYPNIIFINPICKSEKYIVTSKRKETVGPPKKFFLLRWFQKKHWVVEVNIEEKNPYITNINNKFIEIIDND